MKCLYCQGEMERGTAPFRVDRKGYHVTWDALPAWVCPQCGEVYFEETDIEALRLAIEVKKRAIKFYCNAEVKVKDENAKKMFSHLISIEEKHLRELEVQYAWLDQAGFWYDPGMMTD